MSARELYHHGILGMKWGVRRYQNKDGSLTSAGAARYGRSTNTPSVGTYDTVKKGTKIYRISNNAEDKTYGNRKYVSLTKEDHEKWQNYIGDSYNKYGQEAYDVTYKTKSDLKIAHYTEIGRIYLDKIKDDPVMKQRILNDTKYANKSLGYKSDDPYDSLSVNFGMQTETGKMFIDELMKRGYQGVQDRHGQNTADNPVIIFDPDNNLKKKKTSKYITK